MSNASKKLELKTQSIRVLASEDVAHVQGGGLNDTGLTSDPWKDNIVDGFRWLVGMKPKQRGQMTSGGAGSISGG